MKLEEKKEMIELFNEGFTNVVLPHIDRIYDKLQEHTDILQEHTNMLQEHTDMLEEHGDQLESLHGKFDSIRGQADNQDITLENHGKRISKLEIKIAVK